MVDVLQLLVSISSSLWLCDMNWMKSFFLFFLLISLHDWILITSFFSTHKGEKISPVNIRIMFYSTVIVNFFSIFCASFLLVNAPKRGLVLMLFHKEIFVFQEIFQNLLQHLHVLLKNGVLDLFILLFYFFFSWRIFSLKLANTYLCLGPIHRNIKFLFFFFFSWVISYVYLQTTFKKHVSCEYTLIVLTNDSFCIHSFPVYFPWCLNV